MIALEDVPHGLAGMEVAYGDPHDLDFVRNHLVKIPLPEPFEFSWKTPSRTLYIHKKVFHSFLDALADVVDLIGAEKLKELGWNFCGGCYNFRPKRGGSALSTHAWGIAVDMNPALGPFGKPATKYPKPFVEVFEARGWIWGGRWRTPDGMHFQAAKGY